MPKKENFRKLRKNEVIAMENIQIGILKQKLENSD